MAEWWRGTHHRSKSYDDRGWPWGADGGSKEGCLEKHVRHVYTVMCHFVLEFLSWNLKFSLSGEKVGCQGTISHTCAYRHACTQVQCYLPWKTCTSCVCASFCVRVCELTPWSSPTVRWKGRLSKNHFPHLCIPSCRYSHSGAVPPATPAAVLALQDFTNEVCHLVMITIAENNPDMGLLTVWNGCCIAVGQTVS